MAYVRADLAEPGTEVEIDVRGRARAGAHRVQAPLRPDDRTERLTLAEETYPDDLKYHPEHDWARIEGDEADVRDHLVRAGRARRGRLLRAARGRRDVAKDAAYAEVESVKAVSDVIAPLSGEIIAVNEALADAPETINEDPYGDGWLVKVKLCRPGRGRRAARRRGLPRSARRRLIRRLDGFALDNRAAAARGYAQSPLGRADAHGARPCLGNDPKGCIR